MELEDLLCNLISINSGNLNYSKNACGEKEIGNFLYDYFRKNNIDCIKQAVTEDRNNIIAKIDSKDSNDTLLFCSHLDTVYLDGMDFEPKVTDGKIYGPGSCDAKSSLAAMANAFIELKNNNLHTSNLCFAGVISEETLHLGIKKFLEEFKDFNAAIIGEPTSLNIGFEHKGALRLSINTYGKCAHGSNPDEGINAIYNMEKLIHEIRTELIPRYNKKINNSLSSPTLNVGLISGGTAFNVVPDSCFVELDRRILPDEDLEDIISDFRRIIENLKVKEKNFSAEVLETSDYIPYLKTDRKEKIVNTAYSSALKFVDSAQIISLAYTTDGGFLSELKIPTIVLGPGDVRVCHQIGEYVEIDQLQKALKVYKDICQNF